MKSTSPRTPRKFIVRWSLSSLNLLSIFLELFLICSYFPTTERFHSRDLFSKTRFIECLAVRECVTTPLHGLRSCSSHARVLVLNLSVSNLAFDHHRHWKGEQILEVWVVVRVWYGGGACGCGWDDESDRNLGACEEDVHVRSCGRVWVAIKIWQCVKMERSCRWHVGSFNFGSASTLEKFWLWSFWQIMIIFHSKKIVIVFISKNSYHRPL